MKPVKTFEQKVTKDTKKSAWFEYGLHLRAARADGCAHCRLSRSERRLYLTQAHVTRDAPGMNHATKPKNENLYSRVPNVALSLRDLCDLPFEVFFRGSFPAFNAPWSSSMPFATVATHRRCYPWIALAAVVGFAGGMLVQHVPVSRGS
jgi:hypothetical protein